MRTWIALLPAALLAASLAACRQADGPTPAPDADAQNEIGDIARDMINLVNGDPEAPADLSHDISRYGRDEEAADAAREMARRLAGALPSARLDEPTAQRLAHTLWVGLNATELSERQVEAVKNELREILRGAGIEESQAEAVAQQIGTVQEQITDNPRRWYQVF